MTVVASLQPENFPLFVGDLLVSGYPSQNEQVVLPTLSEVARSPKFERMAKGLRQKLAVVGRNIVIGCAGDASIAKDVISELIYRNENEHEYTFSLLKEYFDRQSETVRSGIAVIGSIVEGQTLTRFGIGHEVINKSNTYGEIHAIGTGKIAFQNLDELCPEPFSVKSGSDPVTIADRVVARGYSLTGGLLFHEMLTGQSVEEFKYGAGYEVVTRSAGQFVKVGDVTVIYWRAICESAPRPAACRRC